LDHGHQFSKRRQFSTICLYFISWTNKSGLLQREQKPLKK